MMPKREKNPKRPMPPALKRYWQARNRRLRNPKRAEKRWKKCVRQVGKKRTAINPYAVCSAAVRRRGNPRPTRPYGFLFAQRPGGEVLRYVGGIKFSTRGKAVRVENPMALGRALKQQFPVLRRYRLWATS
jgi:hypothetical protein